MLALPAEGVGLWQTDMRQHTAAELVGHLVKSRRAEIVRGNQGKDGRTGIGSTIHVADMNFIERRFAYAEDQWAPLLETNIGGALDQMRRDAIGDTSQSAHAAWQNNHRARGIRTAGDVGSDIGVRLLMNFSRVAADELLNESAPAAKAQFLRHDAERAVRGDEVHALNPGIAFEGREQMASEQCATGSGRSDGQVLDGVRQLGPSSEIRCIATVSQGRR